MLLAFSEALAGRARTPPVHRELIRPLLEAASERVLEDIELRRVLLALHRIGDHRSALALLDRQLHLHPGWLDDPALLLLRGSARMELARKQETDDRSAERTSLLDAAERDLREALGCSTEETLRSELSERLEELQLMRPPKAPELP